MKAGQRLDPAPFLHHLRQGVAALLATTPHHIIGIHRGGFWLAQWLAQQLSWQDPIGSLNIGFYRDDFSSRGLHPEVRPSRLPFSVEERPLLLIDDVFHSGRTVRAALNEIFDYGRPDAVRLACLIALAGHQLPLQPDICGHRMALPAHLRVDLRGPEPLQLLLVEPAQ